MDNITVTHVAVNLCLVNEGTVKLGVIMPTVVRIFCAPLRLIGLIPHWEMYLKPIYSQNPGYYTAF